MSEVTVSQLASDVGIPVDRLLKQLSEAGVTKQSAEDKISEQEKMDLLNHLRRSHGKKEAAGGTGVRKIALKRKTTTELHQPASGRPTARSAAVRAAKTVSVEVRRKRAVTRPLGDEEAKKQELLREAEEAKRALAEQAEQRRQVEEEADARHRAEEARRQAEEEAQRKSEETRLAAEGELRRQAEEQARLEAEALQPAPPPPVEPPKGTDKPAKKGKRVREEEPERGRHGRRELHVASDKRGQRAGKGGRKAGRRVAAATSDSTHGFQRPTA
ncbi:MAG: translation initiation factor IF-2 associated domain-containing protein, partial [Sedimenticolaceae bacterium]